MAPNTMLSLALFTLAAATPLAQSQNPVQDEAAWYVAAHRLVGCPYDVPANTGVGSSICAPLILGPIYPGESSLEVNPANCIIKFWSSKDCTLGEGEHYYAIGGGDSIGCSATPAKLASFMVEC